MYTETYINYLHMETRLYHRMDRLDREQASRAESKPREGTGGAVFIPLEIPRSVAERWWWAPWSSSGSSLDWLKTK